MQEANMRMVEVPRPKPRKKPLAHPQSPNQLKVDGKWSEMPGCGEKLLKRKRNTKNKTPPSPQYLDRSTPDSLTDNTTSQSEYSTLMFHYLLIEKQNCQLEKELHEVEADVKSLKDEKHALLDELVVLEGLIDPSELRQLQRSL